MCIVCVLCVYYDPDFRPFSDTFSVASKSERACFSRPFRILNGGAEGDRTLDLLNAIQALSQLSYSPTQYLTCASRQLTEPSVADYALGFTCAARRRVRNHRAARSHQPPALFGPLRNLLLLVIAFADTVVKQVSLYFGVERESSAVWSFAASTCSDQHRLP